MGDKLTIDLTNFKDRVGSRVAEGTYRVIVEDVEQTESKSGNTMINLFFRVQGGDFDGANIIDRLVLTEKSLFRVVGFMQAIGLPTPKKRLQISLNQFVNKQLDIQVEDGEPYNGRVKSEVRGYSKIKKSEQPVEKDLSDLEDTPDETVEAEPESAPDTTAPEAAEEQATPAPQNDESSEDVDLDDLNNL